VDSADEETGHRTISSQLSELAFYRHDISVAQALLSCSRSLVSSFGDAVNTPLATHFSARIPELDTACLYHRSNMVEVALRNNCPAHLSGGLFLDYEPYMRQVTNIDNTFEAAVQALNIQHGGRQTRNSRGVAYGRLLQMEEYQKQRMEQNGFKLD
jgi:hypothetical protein